MYFQGIIKVPEATDVLATDANGDYLIGNAVVYWLAFVQAEWVEKDAPQGGAIMPGTRAFGGEKLIHFLADISSGDPLGFVEDLLAANGLDQWSVVDMRVFYPKDLLVPVLDENDQPTGELLPYLPERSIDASYIDFMEDVDRQRPIAPVKLHTYAGGVSFEVPAL